MIVLQAESRDLRSPMWVIWTPVTTFSDKDRVEDIHTSNKLQVSLFFTYIQLFTTWMKCKLTSPVIITLKVKNIIATPRGCFSEKIEHENERCFHFSVKTLKITIALLWRNKFGTALLPRFYSKSNNISDLEYWRNSVRSFRIKLLRWHG